MPLGVITLKSPKIIKLCAYELFLKVELFKDKVVLADQVFESRFNNFLEHINYLALIDFRTTYVTQFSINANRN